MFRSRNALVLGAAVLLVSCARETPAPVANDLVIVGTDFSFASPDTVPAGLTRIRMVSNGPRYLHHVQLVKLEQGMTYDSLMAAMRNPGPPPAWMVFVTGANAPPPGDTTNVYHVLQAGNYALLCFIPDSAMVPHMALGMSKPLVVTANDAPVAALPTADTEMRLSDYNFVTSTPLRSGRQLVRIINDGPQVHEMFLARLDSGATAASLIQWVRAGMRGQPPAQPAGGIVALAPRGETMVELNVTAGRYALLCFLPDASGRGEHVDHGMVQEITIQ